MRSLKNLLGIGELALQCNHVATDVQVRRYLFALEHRFSNTWQVLQGSHWSYDPVMVPSLWVSTAHADTRRVLGF